MKEFQSDKQLTAAQDLITSLVSLGMSTFFGIPGGPVSPIFDAIIKNEQARLIESRQETSAIFAAIGYYRSSGKIPVVVVTAGPGITNAVTGIVSAHLERIPMLVICGDVSWAAYGGKLLQDTGPEGIAAEEMLAKFMRATVRMSQADSALSQGMAALTAATNPSNPGPALLVAPIQTARAKTIRHHFIAGKQNYSVMVPDDAIDETYKLLCAAEKPLIVIGGGCRPYAKALEKLVDTLEVPFTTTPRAKGLISEHHPLSLRNAGLAASMWSRQYTGEGIDVVLVLGTDLDDCSIGPTQFVSKGGKLIHVDTDASVFNRNLPAYVSIQCDMENFIKAFQRKADEQGIKNTKCMGLLKKVKTNSAFYEPSFDSNNSALINPARAIADLQKAAGVSARFITDIGEHMLFALHYLTTNGPDDFDIRLNLGSMGSGIASSIGLALGENRRIVCICGDGGMQMMGMELLVAVKEKLPIIFAIFNDARYNMVYHGHKQVYGTEAPWDTPWIDFVEWGKSIGVLGKRINNPGEITSDLLNDMLTISNGPIVLDIRIDRNINFAGGGRNEALQKMSMHNVGDEE